MIETARFPRCCRVTRDAVVVKVILFVIGVGRAGEVATVAVKAQTWSVSVTGCMTRNTCQRCMRARQIESRLIMIKISGLPGRCGVTTGTIIGEVVLLVIRIGRPCKIPTMAVDAKRRGVGIAS